VFKKCHKCNSLNHAASDFCQNCKAPLKDVSVKTVSGTSPAGFWVRLAAFLVDQLILNAVLLIVLLSLEAAGAKVSTSNPYDLKLNLLGGSIFGTYFTIFTGIEGQTFGKRLMGIRVLRLDGSRVTYARSLARYLAYTVSLLPLGVGFLVIAMTPNKRGWHDYLCDTIVVKVK